MGLAFSSDAPQFGYVMPLRDPAYKSMEDLMAARVTPSFRALATLGYHLAYSFLRLHADGLCYRDISRGNAFFHPETGEALICDNDNVTIDGSAYCGVQGTPKFMAPEIVRDEARPSAHTDRYSLAVLLFYIFMIAHPLDGAAEAALPVLDAEAAMRLYGTDPVFIYDPNNDSNRPVPGIHDNAIVYWQLYPGFLQQLFTQSFTIGLYDPQHGRVVDSQWQRAMVRLRDSIFHCGQCGAENFYDGERIRAAGGDPGSCWACARRLTLPPRIRIGRDVILLNRDTPLYPHHVDAARLWDFSAPVARVVPHQTDPAACLLENLTDAKWTYAPPGESMVDVLPGRRAPLARGAKILFGAQVGEIAV
jgi:hypothetical protein